MALDAGTTSNRAIIFNNKSEIVSIFQNEFTQYLLRPGWVEHDLEKIYSSIITVMQESLIKSGITASYFSYWNC